MELVTGNQFLNLSRRDADVALRPSLHPPEALHGRRLASIAFTAYASPAYLASAGGSDLSRAHAWVGLDDTLSHLTAHRWIRENVEPERIGFKATSFLAVEEAVRAGMGLGLLPCYTADRLPDLVRVRPPIPELATDLWLLVHEDLRRTARVRAFIDFVSAEMAKLRPQMEGELP